MTQDDTDHVRTPPPTVFVHDWHTRAKVDLCLLARRHFDATEWQRSRVPESGHESSNAVVLPRETVLRDQILEDPLSRQALVQLADNLLTKRLAPAP
jgi:hypothetical protein